MRAIWAMLLLCISAVPALAQQQWQLRCDRFRREWLQHLCNEQRSGAGDLYRELFRLDLGWLHANRELHYDDPSRVLRRADLRHRAR